MGGHTCSNRCHFGLDKNVNKLRRAMADRFTKSLKKAMPAQPDTTFDGIARSIGPMGPSNQKKVYGVLELAMVSMDHSVVEILLTRGLVDYQDVSAIVKGETLLDYLCTQLGSKKEVLMQWYMKRNKWYQESGDLRIENRMMEWYRSAAKIYVTVALGYRV